MRNLLLSPDGVCERVGDYYLSDDHYIRVKMLTDRLTDKVDSEGQLVTKEFHSSQLQPYNSFT